jgi:hypothetical protein
VTEWDSVPQAFAEAPYFFRVPVENAAFLASANRNRLLPQSRPIMQQEVLSAMTIQVELSPEAEARLAIEARAHGIAPEKYAGSLLQEVLTSPAGGSGRLTTEQFHTMLDALAEGSEKLPNLPTESFTRESFYEDRA